MKFETRYFGEIDVDENGILQFEEGILGFEDLKQFILLSEGDMIIDWLQCIEDDITFPIIDPFTIKSDYQFDLPEDVAKELQIEKPEDVIVYTVVVIPEDIKKIRTNLQGPIIINKEKKLAKQIILSDEYPMRYEFYDKFGDK